MSRLLQGDVGSGKTVVATAALILAVANGYQGAMMAPTEILAEQHWNTIRKVLSAVGQTESDGEIWRVNGFLSKPLSCGPSKRRYERSKETAHPAGGGQR